MAYESQIDLTRNLIERFGRPVSIVSLSSSPVDLSTPWRQTVPVETVQTGDAVFLDYDARHIDGTLVQRGDKRVYMSTKGLSARPTIKDELRVDAERWTIVNVNTLSPNGEDIMYILQVRQ